LPVTSSTTTVSSAVRIRAGSIVSALVSPGADSFAAEPPEVAAAADPAEAAESAVPEPAAAGPAGATADRASELGPALHPASASATAAAPSHLVRTFTAASSVRGGGATPGRHYRFRGVDRDPVSIRSDGASKIGAWRESW
jgi:hypothetical protein